MRELVVNSIIFRFKKKIMIVFLIIFYFVEVLLENVENLAPTHSIDAFDGNDVLVDYVLLNVGHDVSIARRDPLDGALTQDYGLFFFGVVSHATTIDIVLTQQVLIFIGYVVMFLNFPMKIYDYQFFNHMFDFELPKFRADFERIHG
jgi:hypothetical protein